MSETGFLLKRIEQERRMFLLRNHRMPNLIIMGYGVFDTLIVASEDVLKKIEKDKYDILGMKVLLYPEKSYKDSWELKLLIGDEIT